MDKKHATDEDIALIYKCGGWLRKIRARSPPQAWRQPPHVRQSFETKSGNPHHCSAVRPEKNALSLEKLAAETAAEEKGRVDKKERGILDIENASVIEDQGIDL